MTTTTTEASFRAVGEANPFASAVEMDTDELHETDDEAREIMIHQVPERRGKRLEEDFFFLWKLRLIFFIF